MLEVLDPEQNHTFRDHYLDLPFDLSKVLFICTANTTDTIPGPLLDRDGRDRSSPGYTEDEKLGIAKRYLLPKQLEAHGLAGRAARAHRHACCGSIIREYTREAGVRNLERRIADLCRKAAAQVARGEARQIRVDERLVREWLGPRRFSGEVRQAHRRSRRRDRARVHRRSAATCSSSRRPRYPGKGKLTVTGQLGDVMQESAQAALSWVRSHADALGVDESWFARARRPHPRARRRGAEGRPVGRGDDGDGDRVAPARRAGRRGRRR